MPVAFCLLKALEVLSSQLSPNFNWGCQERAWSSLLSYALLFLGCAPRSTQLPVFSPSF